MKKENQIVAMTKRFVCNKSKDLLINMRLRDMSEIDGKVVNKEPCDECKKLMQQGIIMISAKEPANEEDSKNPYRTGGWVVMKQEAAERIFKNIDFAKQRVMFVIDDAWQQVGLPLSDYQKTYLKEV